MPEYKVEDLGQVFTPDNIVNQMIDMIKFDGRILEPSCGDGAFSKPLIDKFSDVVSIEFDREHCPHWALNMDFFDYPVTEKFSTIIGNPPYVSGKKILKSTLDKIDSKLITHGKSNLYLYFIEKSIHHLEEGGEIIFITPREFIKNTSSAKLNQFIFESGTITHWLEFGDQVIFKGYSPQVVIFRFQKGDFSRKTITVDAEKIFQHLSGQLLFLDTELTGKRLGDLFDVKVGGVSGLDEVFAEDSGNTQFVCSFTRKNGQLKTFHYNVVNEYLTSKKELLLQRKIKKFDESNWWLWGRDFHKSDKMRIYVNCKTRLQNPFFINECKNYDGSVIGLIPKTGEIESNLEEYCQKLNGVDWEKLGFKVGGRFVFTQKTLDNIILDI